MPANFFSTRIWKGYFAFATSSPKYLLILWLSLRFNHWNLCSVLKLTPKSRIFPWETYKYHQEDDDPQFHRQESFRTHHPRYLLGDILSIALSFFFTAYSFRLKPSLTLLLSLAKSIFVLPFIVIKDANAEYLPGRHSQGYGSFSLSRNRKINQKPSNIEDSEKVTSPSVRPVCSPKRQTFVEMFRRNLQSPVWKRHVGVPQWYTNMAAGK